MRMAEGIWNTWAMKIDSRFLDDSSYNTSAGSTVVTSTEERKGMAGWCLPKTSGARFWIMAADSYNKVKVS